MPCSRVTPYEYDDCAIRQQQSNFIGLTYALHSMHVVGWQNEVPVVLHKSTINGYSSSTDSSCGARNNNYTIRVVSEEYVFVFFFFSRATSYSGIISRFAFASRFPSFVPAVRLVCSVVRLCCTLTWVDR